MAAAGWIAHRHKDRSRRDYFKLPFLARTEEERLKSDTVSSDIYQKAKDA